MLASFEQVFSQPLLTPLLMGDAGGKKYVLLTKLRDDKKLTQCRGETVALIGGGGDYSYIRVLPDSIRISFEMNLKTTDIKRKFVEQNENI